MSIEDDKHSATLSTFGTIPAEYSSKSVADSENAFLQDTIIGLRTVLDQTGTYIFTKDTAGRYTYVNQMTQELFGASFEDIVGRDDSYFFDLALANELRLNDRFVIDFGETIEREESNIVKATGEMRIYWTVKKPLRNDQGQIIGLCGISTDITERKMMENALRESEAHLRLSQTGGGIGTWEADLVNNKQRWSENCTSLLGFPAHTEPSWDNFLNFVHHEDRQQVLDATRLHIESGIPFDVEYRAIAGDGSIRHLRSAGQVERDVACKPSIMRGIVQDVTERHDNQQRIEQLVAEQKAIVENQLVGICTTRNRKIVWANDTFEGMFGYGKSELIGSSMRRLYLTEEDYKVVGAAYANFKNNDIVRIQNEFVCKDSRRVWLDMSGARLHEQTNEFLWIFVDVTERKLAEVQIEKSLSLLYATLESTNDAILVVDLNNTWILHNQHFIDLWQITDEILAAKDDHAALSYVLNQLIDPDAFLKKVIDLYATPEISSFDILQFKNGKIIERYSIPQRVNDKVVGRVWSFRNITERKHAEAEMRIAATAFESQEGMLVTDADHNILRVNRAFTSITGYSLEDVVGKNPRIFHSGQHDANFYAAMWESINTTGSWQGEVWNRRKSGEIFPEHLTVTVVKDHNCKISNYVATLTDVTLRKEAVDKIERLAFYDPLTGLPNRLLLQDRLKPALASSHRSGRQGALLFIDLDNFKTLNDTLGHDMGDLLLQRVAQRLESCVREGDTVARLGGDEFVVMLEDLSEQTLDTATLTEKIGNKIMAILNQSYQLDTHEYRSTPSIGVTLFNGQDQSSEELLKQADIAMYQAKTSGRNAMRFFDPQMQASITARVELEKDLRLALENDQFILYYQPQVHHSGQIIGAEVLIRWQHPLRGLVSPAEFIPLAEETGLILAIGQWVMEMACKQIKTWETSEHAQHLQLAVNVSSRQFYQTDFVEQVHQILSQNAINPDRLKLELTESLVLDDIDDTIIKMNELRKIGVRFSMDDFGTGYSSLSSLKKLPLDQLKIDQSFVRDITIDLDDTIIVETIIAMANKLKIEVIAEGVETQAQLAFLEKHDCQLFQGYLFSKPVPIAQFELLLKTNSL